MARPKSNPEAPETEELKAEVIAPVAISATVKMVRDGAAPNTADVHPDEVNNMKLAGWTVAK